MTWRARVILIAAAVVVLGAGGYFVLHRRVSDEERIVGTLLDAGAAVERKDVRETMAAVSEEYHDAAGLNKRLLRLLAWRTRDIEETLRVVMGAPAVTIREREATAEVEVSVYLIDSSGTVHALFEGPVNVRLRKESRGRWRIVDSEGWQQTIEVEQGY